MPTCQNCGENATHVMHDSDNQGRDRMLCTLDSTRYPASADIEPLPRTLTVTAQYSYQAWRTAHRTLRSNVSVVSRRETPSDVTMTFVAIDAPRWPVALRHYNSQARAYANGAVSLMLQGKTEQAREFAEISRTLRNRAQDAQTGHVSNPRTLLRRGL